MSKISSLQAIVVATDDQLYADIEGKTVVLHPSSQTYYSLNPVGGRIWELLQEPHTIEEIRDIITQEYDISPNQCESDIIEFLKLLSEEDLVEFQQNS